MNGGLTRPPATRLGAGLAALCCGLAAQAQALAPPATEVPAASAPAPTTDRVPRLTIDAPDTVRATLSQYLDLARAIADADAPTLSELEWSRLSAATPAQARSLLQPLGYFNAVATIERTPGTPAVITLHVTPGEPVRVGKLTYEFQGELAERAERGDAEAQDLRQALLTSWTLGPERPFANAAWSDAKSAVIAHMRAQGYAAATWSGTAAQVDPASGRVRIFVVLDSGPLYRAGEVVVEGLVHHDLARVQALAPFAAGEAMTEAKLLAYQERLQKTTLFEQVNVSLDGDPTQAEHARVLVRLKEAPRIGATLALGYSANSGPRMTVEHVLRRPLDYPVTLRNKVLWGQSEQTWDGELATHPDADYRRWSLGVTVDRLLTDSDLVLSERLRLGRSRERQGLERFVYTEVERARECEATSSGGYDCVTVDALSGHVALTWRELDNALLPTRGYTLQLQGGAGFARGNASRSGPFARLYGRYTRYEPLGRAWYGQARLEAGQILASDDVRLPDSLRFRAGGDDSVRGYAYRTLAPTTSDGSLTGGRVMWTGSLEIARPVSDNLPSVWWAAFVDAGRAADHWKELQPALGYGLGLRWRSPVGPLRLDLAWGDETHKLRLHMSVGIAF